MRTITTRLSASLLAVLLFVGVLSVNTTSAQVAPDSKIETTVENELIARVKMSGWTFEVRQITITEYTVHSDGTLSKALARFDFLLKTEWEGDSIEEEEEVRFTMRGLNGDPDKTKFEFFLTKSANPDNKLEEETVNANEAVRTYTVHSTGEYRFQVRGENGTFTGTESYRTKIQVFNVGAPSSTVAPIAHDGVVETYSGQRICVDLQQTQYVTAGTVPLSNLNDFVLITKPTQGSVTKVDGSAIPIYNSGTTVSGENTFDGILCYTPPASFEGSLSLTWAVSDGEKMSNHATLTVRVTGVATDIESDELPSELTLSPNYPNPFNPSTTVEFNLPQSARVHLGVYNTLGQELMTLVDGVQPAGSQEINIDLSSAGWASGVYLLRLQSELGTQTQAIVLEK